MPTSGAHDAAYAERMAARPRHRPAKPIANDRRLWEADPWVNPLPVPEVIEGGDSTWDLWHEAARQLDTAFAPTQPSGPVSLSGSVESDRQRADAAPLSADALMVIARRNNRVCPKPARWSELYRVLEGTRYVDLEPPPVEHWIWSKLSDLQRRLRFREHVEWAERHGKLSTLARFMDGLSEADWQHMSEA
jgi:hypothetical protein